MKTKIPFHAAVYIIISTIILVITVVLMILRFKFSIITFGVYGMFVAILISLGLLGTAIISIKDWNKFLSELER